MHLKQIKKKKKKGEAQRMQYSKCVLVSKLSKHVTESVPHAENM